MGSNHFTKGAYFLFAFISVTGCSPSLKDLGYKNYSCEGLMGPSKTIPKSAHSVRPADIKVVGALGDSLTAGFGAGATSIFLIGLEDRGLVFTIGGDKGLEDHVTIPNILLHYNPGLIGQSHGISGVNLLSSTQLNVAVSGAKSGDLQQQAHELVRRINTNPKINVQEDWKLIHILIGGNDICAKCMDTITSQVHSSQNFQDNLRKTIQILADSLPRVIVSIIGMFQMELLRTIDASVPSCELFHTAFCPCIVLKSFDIATACESYQAAQVDLQTSGIFDGRDDFTLIVQPFLFNTNSPPLLPNGKVNLDIFAPDCFHSSAFGNAVAAKGLWNNLLQPVSRKSTSINLSDPSVPLLCPDPSCPFIRTTKNSLNCAPYLTMGR